MTLLWKRGLRIVARAAVAFALSTAAAIGVGAAVTDNAFVQILLTVFIALAFWIPFFFLVLRIDRWVIRRRRRGDARGRVLIEANAQDDDIWRRLVAVAPQQSQRLTALRRALEKSRLSLGDAKFDPDAHELCILIDRRLPELINHELGLLPPDDRHRRHKVSELIDLIEQFARHCSHRDTNSGSDAEFEAEVLRRRFEARLKEF